MRRNFIGLLHWFPIATDRDHGTECESGWGPLEADSGNQQPLVTLSLPLCGWTVGVLWMGGGGRGGESRPPQVRGWSGGLPC